MGSPSDRDADALRREVLRLRGENTALWQQVDELIRGSAQLERRRARLEERERLYRGLATLRADGLELAESGYDVARQGASFIATDLGYERVLLEVSEVLQTVHVGFASEPGLPREVFDALPAPVWSAGLGSDAASAGVVVHTAEAPHPLLGELAASLGMIELAAITLRGTDGTWLGFLCFGCSDAGRASSARLGKDDDHQLEVAQATASALAAALEHRRSERRLRDAMERARAANRTKSRFVANMTHELRTPLNAIIGYTELIFEELEERGGVGELAEDVHRVLSSSHHLLRLIDDVLDIARVEAGSLRIEVEPFDVAALARGVVAALEPTADAKGNALSIQVSGAERYGPEVNSDPARLRQVLTNLVANAVKFTRDGVVAVRVSVDPEEVQLEVRDTGIGMSPEALERVFRPFEQADNSTTRRFGGTGLGLHITKQLVGLLGGTIEVESTPGKGSLFRVAVPRNAEVAPTG